MDIKTSDLIKRMKNNMLTVDDINIIGNRLVLLDSLKEFGDNGLIYKNDNRKGFYVIRKGFYVIDADIFALSEKIGDVK